MTEICTKDRFGAHQREQFSLSGELRKSPQKEKTFDLELEPSEALHIEFTLPKEDSWGT